MSIQDYRGQNGVKDIIPIKQRIKKMSAMIKKLVNHGVFNNFITAIILVQAAVLVLETISELKNYIFLFDLINAFVLSIFIIEAALKIFSSYPNMSKYFRNGWNILDFSIIVVSLLPLSGGYTTVARLIRLLRVVRLTNRYREMSVVVMTLIKSLPSMVNVFLLLSLIFFIYGIAGYNLFNSVDAENWGTLPRSILTLFQILTLEGWVEIMSDVTNVNPLYVIYFVSFIMIGTFVVINIFVAVIVKKSEDAYKQIENTITTPVTQKEILVEIKEIRKKIEDLESRLNK
ncbi:MAG: ion transporter [Thermoproteota archaeon]|nr:ion transporter [Thermoproteota archaeon]